MDILNHANSTPDIESVLNTAPEMFTNMMNNHAFQELPSISRQGTIYTLTDETKYNMVENYSSVGHSLNIFNKNAIKAEPNCLDFGEASLETEISYKTTDERYCVLFGRFYLLIRLDFVFY